MEPPIPSPEPDPTRTTSSVQLQAVGQKVGQNNVLTVIVGAVVTLGLALIGRISLSSGSDVHQQIEDVRKADEAAHKEIHEDIKDLYKSMWVGKPSERLEREDAGKP